jgi:transcriptional adapter 3
LLPSQPNFTDPVDDPIATALRQAQRELREVVATNKARKTRLLAIAKDRLGYQEYVEAREALDKNILALYTKLQKKDGPKVSKKKKARTETNGSAAPASAGATPPIGAWPSAAGLGPDDENTLRVPEALAQLIATRRQWVDSVGDVFDAMEQEQPGRIYGLPERSLYEGLDADVAALLGRTTDESDAGVGRSPTGDGADKGKGRATGEAGCRQMTMPRSVACTAGAVTLLLQCFLLCIFCLTRFGSYSSFTCEAAGTTYSMGSIVECRELLFYSYWE